MHYGRVIGCNCGIQAVASGIFGEDVEDGDEGREKEAGFLPSKDRVEVDV